MDTVTLGRTGLDVSVACLGAGGHSRLGMRAGASEAQAAELVRAAVGRGITLIDTARSYGTEDAVGLGLQGLRDGVVISSKARCTRPGTSFEGMDLMDAGEVRESVETSLKALRTDRIDILHVHGVRPQQYDHCVEHLLPELLRLRDEGKIRFLGITEGFGVDGGHVTMQRAVREGVWDVLMLGYNFVNPSAAELVLPQARANGLGVMCMYAVRSALARRETLRILIDRLVEQGEVDATTVEGDDPMGFLLEDGVAGSFTEAAYRFCRHTPGIDVVMTGTGNLAHLDQNIAAIQGAPLPAPVLDRLAALFGRVRSATGDPEKE
ncbi:MAG: aldo/keto reductase [Rhizobiaceae bacterium]